MKGYTTQLSNVPSMVYYQSQNADTFESDPPIQIEFFIGAVTLKQGKDGVLVSDEYLKDLFQTILKK